MRFRSVSTFLTILTTALFLLVTPARAENPYAEADDSWISVSGTVVSTELGSFLLDYGEGMITVEFDDWTWYDDNHAILAGDDVTVYGIVDDDLYETRTIEASSVYVEGLNTYYYASPADEEEIPHSWYAVVPGLDGEQMSISGEVTRVDGREFTIDTGLRSMTVDTIAMPYNPMDENGFQKIETGDWVSVRGQIDLDVFEQREIIADSIVTLFDS